MRNSTSTMAPATVPGETAASADQRRAADHDRRDRLEEIRRADGGAGGAGETEKQNPGDCRKHRTEGESRHPHGDGPYEGEFCGFSDWSPEHRGGGHKPFDATPKKQPSVSTIVKGMSQGKGNGPIVPPSDTNSLTKGGAEPVGRPRVHI